MTEILSRLFIQDYKNTDKPSVRFAYGRMAGLVGILCNVLLCVGKFLVGALSGSMSIAADAVNNLSDAASGVIGLLGFKLAEKHADSEHPYGHGRYEYLAGFIVAALILVIGFELLKDSVAKIISPSEVEFGLVSAGVLAFSIIVKLWLMLFYKKIGKKINSETLRASSADSRNDVISTGAVLVALTLSEFIPFQLDGIMGALVAVFILYSGIGLIKEAMNPLLGRAPSKEQAEEIRTRILSYDGVLGTHDLMIHDYGPDRQFASAHVEVSSDMTLTECHELIDGIERDFLKNGLNLLIHPDPIVSGKGEINDEISDIIRDIDERITVHDIRVTKCGNSEKIIFDCVVPEECGIDRQTVGELISEALQKENADRRIVITFDDGYASIPKYGETD